MPAALDAGLAHPQFWGCTPAELGEVVEAARRRAERDWYRTAWLACYVLAPHTKKKLTPEKLLGKVKATGGAKARPERPAETEDT